MKIIFGLGNPERNFENTPHNVGFAVLDKLCEKLNTTFSKKKLGGLLAEAVINSEKVWLIKPLTYMNQSGECVLKYVKKFKIPLEDILVVVDDIDLPAGDIRFRQNGSGGTHNGLKNIVELLKTTQFPRLRVGVGKPPQYVNLADFVLAKMNFETLEQVQKGEEMAVNKILELLKTKNSV